MSNTFTMASVMGWPVAHSRYPVIHNHWVREYQLSGAYGLFPVDHDDWEITIRSIKALGLAGCNLTISHRSRDEANALAQEFGSNVSAFNWSERHEALIGASLLVNTTNQGMHGEPPLDITLDQPPADALVSDTIYISLETPLLAAAPLRGNATVNGLGMLLHQAAPAFHTWFGAP